MSLITRCPACGTMFKVVPDQLRISEGWVRCGQCAEIFDANASLQEPEAAEAAEGPELALAPSASLTPDAEPVPSPPPSPTAAEWPEFRSTVPPVQKAATEAAAPIAIPLAREAPDSIDAPPLYPSFPSEVLDSQVPRDVRDREEEPDLDSVSFVRHARRKVLWGHPLARGLLFAAAILLAVLLSFQYLVQERDRLAAARPSLRPLLQAVCSRLRCEVGAPRQIESIMIDSSSFSRLRSDVYRLSFSVRSQAPIQVAMPSIELTLTDSQDQPVIRRVLAPRDIGAAAAIPALGESTSSVVVAVAANGGGSRIAGYRMLAFYP